MLARFLPWASLARLLKEERMKKSGEACQLTEGDQQAFHALYLKYHHRVYSTCLRMTKNASESEDLAQDIFVRLFRTVGTFRGESAFTTWLHRVTVNHVLMHFRKRKLWPEQTCNNEEWLAYKSAQIQAPVRMKIVDRILLTEVIAKLPDGYRQAIILHEIEGLEHREIAQRRGRSVGTSKSQLHKGRAMLRKLISAQHQLVKSQSGTSPV
jgi:RNA polymerase sigma-70 factor (ECF subfamily)